MPASEHGRFIVLNRIDTRAINLRKSSTSDTPIGKAASRAFLSSCATRDVSAGGVPLRKAAVSVLGRPQSKGDITESLSSSFSDDDDTAEGVHCCGVQRCVKTGVVASIVGRSSTRVIAARGRLRKHERGARPAEASLIDGECRVIARSALFPVA